MLIRLLIVVVAAGFAGMVASLLTELPSDRASSRQRPGGAIATGLTLGVASALSAGSDWVLVPVGGAAGLLGWVLYRLLCPEEEAKQ